MLKLVLVFGARCRSRSVLLANVIPNREASHAEPAGRVCASDRLDWPVRL